MTLNLLRYAASRVAQAAVVLLGAYTLTFLGIQLLPGDPITTFLTNNDMQLDPQVIAVMKSYYGFNGTVVQQYSGQLGQLLTGNLGYSITSGRPVLLEIRDAAPSTVRLAAAAVGIALLITFVIVAVSDLGRGGWLRAVARALPALMAAIPTFWLSLIVLRYLSFELNVMSIFPDESLLSLLVPALMLAIFLSAPLSQVLVDAVEHARGQPFVKTLQAKGAGPSWIFFRHLLKYVAGSAVTLIGLMIGTLLAGAVVTETVFSRPGVGRMLERAVTNQDLALVQGFVLLVAAIYVITSLTVDLLYPLLDPRIVPARALSGKADTALREENASNQKDRAQLSGASGQ